MYGVTRLPRCKAAFRTHQLIAEVGKLANFIDERKGTIPLNQAMLETENKIDSLKFKSVSCITPAQR